jgi:hypothetical protein
MAAQLPPCVAMFMPPVYIHNGRASENASPKRQRSWITQANPEKYIKKFKASKPPEKLTDYFYKSRVLDRIRLNGCCMSHNKDTGTLVGLHHVLQEFVNDLENKN